MKTFLIIKFCALFILSNYEAVGILNENEETVTKPSVQETLPWEFHFADMPPKIVDPRDADEAIPPAVPPEERSALFDSFPKYSDNNGDYTKCPPGATGSFHYPPDCKRYLNCWKGRGTVQVCAPGTLFNPETKECDFPSKVNCNASPQPLSSQYVRFPEGRPAIPPNPRISRKDHYQVAETSFQDAEVVRPYPGRPPYFGSSHLNRPTARPTTPRSPSKTGKLENARPVCPEGATGLFPHPFDCRKFLNCWDGRTFVQMCGPGTVFNPAMSVCDHPSPSLCSNNGGGDLDAFGTENKEEEFVLPAEYVRGPKPDPNYGRNKNQPQGQQNVPLDPEYNPNTNKYSPRDPKSREPSYRPGNPQYPPSNNQNNYNHRPHHGYNHNHRPLESSDLFGKPTEANLQQPERPSQGFPPFPGTQGQTSNSNFFEEEEPLEPTRRPPKSFPPYPSSQGQIPNNNFGEDPPRNSYGQKLPPPQNQKKPDYSFKNKIKYDAYGNPISPNSLDQQKPYSNPNSNAPTQSPPSYGWGNPLNNQQPTPPTGGNSRPYGQQSTPPTGGNSRPYGQQPPLPTGSNSRPYGYQPTQPTGDNFPPYGQQYPPTNNQGFPPYPNKNNAQPQPQPQPQIPPYHGYVNPLSNQEPASQLAPTPARPYAPQHPHNQTSGQGIPNYNNKDNTQPNHPQPQNPPYYGWVNPQTGQPFQPQSHYHPHPHHHHHQHPPYNNPYQPPSLPYPYYPNNNPQYPPAYPFNGNNLNVQNNPYLYPIPPNQDPQRPPYGFPQVPPPFPQTTTTTEQYPNKNKTPKPPKAFPKFPGNKNEEEEEEEDPIPSGSENDPKYEKTPTVKPSYEDKNFKGRTSTPKPFPKYPGKNPKNYDENAEIVKDKSPAKVTSKNDFSNRKLEPERGFPEDARNDKDSLEESPDNQYTTTEKPIKKIKFSPSNQTIRLRGGRSHLDGYLEVKMSDLTWGIACDEPNGWQIDEANVICKDLGFVRGAELSWQGYPIKSEDEEFHESLNLINCTGNEVTFAECNYTYAYETDSKCDISRNAIGIRCYPNLASHCQPGEIHYKERCYRLIESENPDDLGLTLGQASDSCRNIGGRLLDINNQHENDFISEWLVKNYPEIDTVMTGGVGLSIMGSPLWIWEGSDDNLQYKQWWSGWTGKKELPIGKIKDPVCIILRKTYKCSEDDEEESKEDNGQQTGAEWSDEEDKEECSADYFFWDVVPCQKLPDLKYPHICERPVDDIGCVIGRGEDYLGTANTTASGLPCLPWDHPKVQEGLARRFTPQERSARLTGHNYCRNLGGNDRHPWCFVEGKGNSEYCAIPQCYETVPGYSRSLKVKSSCSENQFECKPGECINRQWFCDGDKDCSNGKDEETCIIFLQEFVKSKDKRLKIQEKQKWPSTTENTCAKLCLESKNFKCLSFSYNVREKYCFLSDTNSGLSGQVTPEKGWNYYERSAETIPCTMENGFFECHNGQCLNISNVCDGKKHCSDNSDEMDCSRLGYEIRLSGSQEKHKGRVEIKILGQWGAICDDKFDLRDADVVCRELGFKHGAVEVLQHSQYPIEKPLFLVDDLDCRGNETSIRDCNFSGWGKHDCTAQETVGVVCRVSGVECPDGQWQCETSKECISTSYLCDNTLDCDDESDENEIRCKAPTQIRLAGGPNATSGRLEIKRFDIWGTICDDDFNSGAATVACRILGYFGPSYVKKAAFFGPGKGPIWLDEVNCLGNETDLEKCAFSSWGQHNCKHDEDVSIICSKEESINQKSLSLKPIAQNSIDEPEINKEEILREVLLSECSDNNGNYPKIIYKPNPQLARVVGSSVVEREEAPWQASVRVRTISGKTSHWCGAIIISPYHVLTAAHCMRDFKKAAYLIRIGDYDTEVADPSEQEFEVDNFYMHPAFSKDLHLNNDIALVKIKGEMKFNEKVKPACLAPSLELYKPGTNCTISGWGSISPQSSGYARTLRRAFVPILEPSICKAPYVYKDRLSDGMFCAGHLDGGADSCQGDSGGPFMCYYEGKSYLFGITSWGLGCGRPNKPGVYTNVAYYLDWIQEKIKLSVS